jgi:hypothetical protein
MRKHMLAFVMYFSTTFALPPNSQSQASGVLQWLQETPGGGRDDGGGGGKVQHSYKRSLTVSYR